MGHPRSPRKKYSKPSHPWQKERIEEEKALLKAYGLKNKKEIWRIGSKLSKIKNQAKILSASTTEQAKKETEQLMNKLKSYGLISDNASYDEILNLTTKDLMERRLQTVIMNKKLARTAGQARQMIVHDHVKIGSKVISSPSYLVRVKEESMIGFGDNSAFKDEEHPERFAVKTEDEIKAEVRRIKESEQQSKEEAKAEEKPEENVPENVEKPTEDKEPKSKEKKKVQDSGDKK